MKTSRFRVGDHLVVQRLGYTHHGLYIGSDQVVHYISSLDGLVNRNNTIGITSVSEFSQGSRIKIKLHDNPRYSPEEAADRACLRIGENDYRLLTNNCEHFVNWCLEGEASSEQVQRGQQAAQGAVTAAAIHHPAVQNALKTALVSGGAVGTGLAVGTLATTTTTATTVGLAGFVGSSAGLGSAAGPVGAAVGAGLGLAAYGAYRLFKD